MPCPLLSAAGAAGLLQNGGVLLLATDTLPGLHCRADRPQAVARILAAKGRPDGKPLLLLAGSADQADAVLADLADWQRAYRDRCWPGPFSLILPGRPELPPAVTGPAGAVAVRVPGPAPLRELVLAAGHPLVSTSANRTGEPAATDLDQAWDAFGSLVDGAWAPDSAPAAGVASAVVDLTRRPPVVVREGPLPAPPDEGSPS